MVTIKERKVSDGYVYDILKDGKEIKTGLTYESAILAAQNSNPVEIVYLNGDKPNYKSELEAIQKMIAKWG